MRKECWGEGLLTLLIFFWIFMFIPMLRFLTSGGGFDLRGGERRKYENGKKRRRNETTISDINYQFDTLSIMTGELPNQTTLSVPKFHICVR